MFTLTTSNNRNLHSVGMLATQAYFVNLASRAEKRRIDMQNGGG